MKSSPAHRLGDHVLHEREAPQDTVRPPESPSKQAAGDSDSAGDHVPATIQPGAKPDRLSCHQCRFFDRDEGMPDESWVAGVCRRRAPVEVMTSYLETRWPAVRQKDWCGEHEPRESEPSHE